MTPEVPVRPEPVEGRVPRSSGLSFVGVDTPALADLQNCIHCGFCLPSCPTYIATGQELESPRGRLHLIHGVLTGRTEVSDRLLSHLDLCLQCRACETACPSSVPYGRIMEDARAAIMANPASERPRSWRLRAFVLREVLARPRRLRAALALGRLYTRSGLQRAVRGPLRRWLPAPLARLEALAPVLDRAPFRRTGVLATPAAGPRPSAVRPDASTVRPEPVEGRVSAGPPSPVRGEPVEPHARPPRVALLLGCVHGELYPQMHEATVRVLARLGCEVVAPPAQGCCGALHTHAGDAETARALARRNIAAFEAAEVDAVTVNAAGCGAAMKEYGRLLRHDERWHERAERFASTVLDVLEFVAEQDFAHGLGRVEADVTLQDACHLAHAQRIRQAPRTILGAIPGLRLREQATPDRCCGSAGIYSAVQPAMSAAVLEAKMADIASTGASVVCTANPGCTLQLQAGVRRSGYPAEVRHVIELLDESYRAGDAARGAS